MATAIIKGRTGATATAIIEAPPRHGKTELISKWLPVWFLIRWPEKRLIMTTATHKLARKLGRNARDLFREHAPKFGLALSESQSAADEWETSAGGGMLAAGVGGPIMGRGADLLILDDPIRNGQDALSETVRDNQWDWWQSTASTRLEPNGKTIVISTRWHEDDIVGRILKAAAADGTGEDDAGSEVARLTMPAIAGDRDQVGRLPGAALWPERFPIQRLERIKAKKSRFWWNALFQQNPGKWGDSRWEDYLGPSIWAARWPDSFEASIVAVDPSLGLDDRKGDFSAIVFVGLSGGKLWVDASIERRPVTRIAQDAVKMALQHRATAMSLEANGFQQVLAPAFHQAATDAGAALSVVLLQNRIKKELRIDSLEPLLAAGQFVFRDTTGCRLLVDQLGEFPRGDHDDGPDALEMAVRGLNERARLMAIEQSEYIETVEA